MLRLKLTHLMSRLLNTFNIFIKLPADDTGNIDFTTAKMYLRTFKMKEY